MQITVTQHDIDSGERCGCYVCPVALAFRRATGRLWSVTGSQCRVNESNDYLYLPTPVIEFVHAFDDDGAEAVKPFSFELDVEDYLNANPVSEDQGPEVAD